MKKIKEKIAVAMSGGLDSSFVAWLLKNKGYEVIGLFMDLGIGQQDAENAVKKICGSLAIEFHKVNAKKEFKKEVIGYFLESYQHGITPNPCVRCNKKIKFGLLAKYAKSIGADKLATGHYVISRKSNVDSLKSNYRLLKARDKDKDQSYFLYTLDQMQLAQTIFPLGNYLKNEIRSVADKNNLSYIKKESQDICFLYHQDKAVDHNMFLKKYLKEKPGPILTLDGRNIGKHEGLFHFTIGQRRGIRIGGIGPFYAARMDFKKNILYVTDKFDDPILFGRELKVKKVNWINGSKPNFPLNCQAVIRYRHLPVKCQVFYKNNFYQVKFIKSQRAITPGQSIVFYQGNSVIGGGIIIN